MRYKIFIVLFAFVSSMYGQNVNKLWYDEPAHFNEEGLLIGNGKLGATIFGGIEDDMMYLNDITFWSGMPEDHNADAEAYKNLKSVRDALFAEDYAKADTLQFKLQADKSAYYMPLTVLHLFDKNKGTATRYRRELNLDSALAVVTYKRNGIKYRREYIASHPDKVLAIHITCDGGRAIYISLQPSCLLDDFTAERKDDRIILRGHAMGEKDASIHFTSMVFATSKDGIIEYKDDGTIDIRKASEVTIYYVNETSFNGYNHNPVTEGADCDALANADLEALKGKTYEDIHKRQYEDYSKIFSRVQLDLGGRFDNSRTTDMLLRDNTDYGGGNERYLEQLYFQYGRYLLISCSRTPGVPANLQGLWTWAKTSPWRSNYTMNINLEENYWPAEVANIGETTMPLADFVKALSDNGSYTAKHFYNINEGWCACHNSDLWAMSHPAGAKKGSPSWSNWNMGGAWIVETLWEHYLFSQDKNYLRQTAYPLMKGAAQFMLQWLIDNPKNQGELITAPSTSPENLYLTPEGYKGATVYGGTADLAIIRELFINTVEASKILGKDASMRKQMENALKKMRPYHIGKKGNIQEWYYDWEDSDPHHRHQSHLIGLYPGHHVTADSLLQAAAKTLELKGDNSTGWSTGWRINLWARLHNGNKAYQIFQKLLTYIRPDKDPRKLGDRIGGTFPNLLDAHPPFQIDGNFGGTAGICEMLLQSSIKGSKDSSYIELLPALPSAWKDGCVSGLCARGGYEISMTWKDSRIVSASILSKAGGKVTVKYNGIEKTYSTKTGETVTL